MLIVDHKHEASRPEVLRILTLIEEGFVESKQKELTLMDPGRPVIVALSSAGGDVVRIPRFDKRYRREASWLKVGDSFERRTSKYGTQAGWNDRNERVSVAIHLPTRFAIQPVVNEVLIR